MPRPQFESIPHFRSPQKMRLSVSLIPALLGLQLAFSGCGSGDSEPGPSGEADVTNLASAQNGASALRLNGGPDPNFASALGDAHCSFVSASGTLFTCRALLGMGASGSVYLVSSSGGDFALKRTSYRDSALAEVEALSAVRGQRGFQTLVDWWESGKEVFIVSNLLGPSIESIRSWGGRPRDLSLATVGSIGLQLVDRIEFLHSRGFVHLDLYPNNFGVDAGSSGKAQLMLFDFGEAKRYIDSAADKTRQFDVRALSHSLLQLLRPGTPFGDYKHYQDSRLTLDQLCAGLPRAVLRLFRYSHEQLGLNENPDYEFMRTLLRELAPEYSGVLIW